MLSILATSFIFCTVGTFATAVSADEGPKRSAELQVLDRFVSIWDMSVTVNGK